jgi:lipopolysaccharide transport system ATP-binding protein
MSNSIITAKNVGKKYIIAHEKERYLALRDVVGNAVMHPFASAHKKARELFGYDQNEEFWALRGVDFEIPQGEVVGIIGRNGAGKSTLLKILTKITPPTEGEIRMRGRVASLLEVGTGFHPELTGRENIFLNGAILGMTNREISRKFDEIVAFADIDKFIDTPVKRYSSGMYVRLAFSVAAHLEPDILLVDEVLAVGDAAFQKKCLGKMDEVAKADGRTILFVSHNMDAVARLCKTSMLIEGGKRVAFGETDSVIGQYMASGIPPSTHTFPLESPEISVLNFSISQDGEATTTIDAGKETLIDLRFDIHEKLNTFRAGIYISNNIGTLVTRSFLQDWNPELSDPEAGVYHATLTIPARLLMNGEYQVELKLFSQTGINYFEKKTISEAVRVNSAKDFNEFKTKNNNNRGAFLIPAEWQTEKIS